MDTEKYVAHLTHLIFQLLWLCCRNEIAVIGIEVNDEEEAETENKRAYEIETQRYGRGLAFRKWILCWMCENEHAEWTRKAFSAYSYSFMRVTLSLACAVVKLGLVCITLK